MSSSKNGGFYQFGSFAVDASKRRLTRDGESLRLNPKAFDLLVALLERHGEVATKDELLARVWESQFVEEGNLTVHIAAIRKALGEKRNGTRFIATVPGRGYQFVGEISQGHTTLVEERSVSRITIETETDEAGDEASGQKYLSSGSTRSRYPILAVVIAAVVIPLLIYAFYVGPGRRGTSTVNATSERNSRQLSTTGNVSTAAISHDGRYFVYKTFQNGKYAIWYGSTSGGSPVQVKTPDDPNYEGLTFSAAGDAIIYAFNGNLFKIPVLGGPPQMLLAHVSHGFSLSRDDKSVVYTTSDPSRGLSLLISADLETGERKELATLPNDRGFGNYPALSPDGKTVAVGVTDRKGSTQAVLVGVDVATGKMTVLDQQEWDIIGKTAWLPDGSAILFNTVGSKSDFHIWMLNNASGELHCVTDDLSRYGRASLTMTDDGTKLLAVRGNLNSNIWIAGPGDLKHLRQVTSGTVGKLDGSAGLAWATDGKIVYSSFFDNSYSIWMIDPANPEPRQLTPSGAVDKFPSATADGRYIVFQSNRGGGDNIWRINADGSDLRKLTDGGNNSSPDVTADGQWIVYEAGRDAPRIMKMPIEGGDTIQLTPAGARLPKISPEGRYVVCLLLDPETSRRQVAIFPIEGGIPVYRFDYPTTATFNNGFHWSPDGSSIVYRDFGTGLWQQPISGGMPQKVPDVPDERIYFFDWSRDGRQLALSYGNEFRDVVLISNFH